MIKLIRYSITLILSVGLSATASAQSKEYYYDQSTRYGTFRHYSNGGSKLISTFRGQQDYAADMAAAQRDAARMTAERERQRQIELDRMRKQQSAGSGATYAVQKNYGPTPADLARQAEEEKARFYRQYENLLVTAKDLSSQALVLSEMHRLRPTDEIRLRLFGVYAELMREEDMDKLHKSFSPEFLKANEDAIWTAYASKNYKTGSYKLAIVCFDNVKNADLNSFTQNLCSRVRLRRWNELPKLFEEHAGRFSELSSIANDLRSAFKTLQEGQIGTPETRHTAETLYQHALARRQGGVMDFVNILALDVAVSLEPQNTSYREERFNSNAILKMKQAMQEDYDFLSK